jgi:hypothetical protein
MAAHLRPLPVRSGMVHAVRDWKSWLAPLDNIKETDGLVGITGARWFCFTRRQDLPLDVAALELAPGDVAAHASAPGDVVCMAKEFMSSPGLLQAPLTICRAGRSHLLPHPEGPPCWQPNRAFSHEDQMGAARLAEKVLRLLPARARAVEYMQEWMGRPLVPHVAPQPPPILQRRCGAGEAIGVVLERAVSGCAPGRPRLMAVRRRPGNNAVPNVALPAWIAFREAQEVLASDAVQEWNAARLMQENGGPDSEPRHVRACRRGPDRQSLTAGS